MRIVSSWMYAITRYGYPPGMAETLKVIAELAEMGYEYAEMEGVCLPSVNETNLEEVFAHKDEIRQQCTTSGLQPVLFFPILPDLVSHDAGRRDAALALFRRSVEMAVYLGCDMIATDSFAPPLEYAELDPQVDVLSYGKSIRARLPRGFEWARHWDILVTSMSHCAREAELAGLRLVVEPRVGEVAANSDALLKLFDDVGSEAFGAILDTGHLNAQKEILALSVAKLGKKLFHVHVADNDSRDNLHLLPGKGTIDWDGLFQTLQQRGYAGDVAVDVGKVPDIAGEYRTCLTFLEELAVRHGFTLAHRA